MNKSGHGAILGRAFIQGNMKPYLDTNTSKRVENTKAFE